MSEHEITPEMMDDASTRALFGDTEPGKSELAASSCSVQRIHKLECALREIETWARNSDLFPTNREALERIARHAVTAIESKPNTKLTDANEGHQHGN
jgi:hypothetical protein